MMPPPKHWRSKRIKSTLPDRIGKDAARLWYTISLGLQEAELRHLLKEREDERSRRWGGGYISKDGRKYFLFHKAEVQAQAEKDWAIHDSIHQRHCKIERLKRFLNNLQK